MRRTLAAFWLSLGLVACGGTVDTSETPEELQERQVEQAGPPALLPYCWNHEGTRCLTPGKTQNCTDGIWSDYVCTCRTNYTWDCPEVR
ncbi:hypothetical protein [Hyalangium rubrum]|uniref:Lipoprotein n=1 Tax=Hyalangium rubrum TaxID=3103134 RepID=A0ABU5H385_9BACT|nr:hypothetical protein [Hyalangium sp. s54d21]MDY7227572.1 hypothetical protein [Hyalangium sp. s54d21]